MPVDERRLCEHIADTADNLYETASRLVAAKSVTGDEAPAQDVVIEEFEAMGLDPDVWEPSADALADHPGYFVTSSYEEHGYERRPNVVAIREGTGDGRSLGFTGHADVVDVKPSSWTYDPWDGTIDGDRMYGRGAADMKGGIAAYIHAVRALDELGISLAGDLYLQTTIEEEAGGVGGVLSALERGYRPDATVIPEPYRIPNIGIASAGVMYFRVRVPGKAAHAARGYKGVNAIDKAVRVCDALIELDRERKARISYEPVVRRTPEAEGEVTNLNLGNIHGGNWPSTVPEEVTVEGRIGWPPGETRTDVRRQLEEAVADAVTGDGWLSEHEPTVEWFGWSAEPHELDPSEEIVQLSKRRAEEITGGKTAFIGGDAGLDERFYNLYYDVPCPTVGPRGDNLHGADEYVELDSLVETAQTLALVAMDWCGAGE